LLLARLFTRPANVLVFDEPTNDLDLETLELLENLVAEFDGTVLVVSHDRAFLDNVVTSTLGFDGQGSVREYVGGYADWIRQGGGWATDERPRKPRPERPRATPTPPAGRKLKWKEERELEVLPARIEELEVEQASLHAALADPDLYRTDGDVVARHRERLEALEVELAATYARWEELEDIAGS
jgi:ATP-binding cassette subfamily F protein uup